MEVCKNLEVTFLCSVKFNNARFTSKVNQWLPWCFKLAASSLKPGTMFTDRAPEIMLRIQAIPIFRLDYCHAGKSGLTKICCGKRMQRFLRLSDQNLVSGSCANFSFMSWSINKHRFNNYIFSITLFEFRYKFLFLFL